MAASLSPRHDSCRALTLRSTGRAGSCLLVRERRRGAPVTSNVRPHAPTRAHLRLRGSACRHSRVRFAASRLLVSARRSRIGSWAVPQKSPGRPGLVGRVSTSGLATARQAQPCQSQANQRHRRRLRHLGRGIGRGNNDLSSPVAIRQATTSQDCVS